MATERAGSKWVAGVCLGVALGMAACNDGRDLLTGPAAPAGPAPGEAQSQRLFFDDFESGDMALWEPAQGQWDLRQRSVVGTGAGDNRQEYGTRRVDYGLTMAGDPNWTDYTVQSQVIVHDDRKGQVGLAGRLQGSHFHYELLLGRVAGGARSWFLRQRLRHSWTTLASGPYDYELGTPQIVRLAFRGKRLEGSVSRDGGRSFVSLGAAEATGATMNTGRIGLISYGGDATFDDVLVIGDGARAGRIAADQAHPFGPIVLLRDNTTMFPTGKPPGGWFVAPIHATLRPHDGKVIISGYSRAGEKMCETDGVNENSSRNGTSWVLDPAALNPPTLFIQPINEQGQDPVSDVIYCAGHNMISGGRVFFSGGSRHPGGFPFSNERGLNYGRIFNFDTGAFTRISTAMKGGTTQLPGEKWYPTNRLMPDGQVLIFGGFTFNSGGTGDRKNRSLELFDPAAWDLNPAGDPWTVLTQHAEAPFGDETTPTRGYTNLFLLPRPLPAANGAGIARTVALMAGLGKVFLFNHEPGPTGAQRLMAKTSAMIPNGSSTEKGEGSSGVQLYDGRLMFVNGGHLGSDAAKAYFYTPSTDSWTSVALGVSRIFGDALFLPDGRVMIINGYVSEPGNSNDVTNPIGDPRQPEIIDPYTDPPTVTTLPGWDDQPWRGYHSIALVLKDGRILLGAGKDTDHATGCEKNDMRIFEPPYLFGGGARPVINLAEGTAMTVGGGALTVPYTGTVRTTRGVALMAPGSLTHGFDMGQRYVPLAFTDNGDGTLTVQPPENVNIAPPGDYLLHIVSTTGVPSVGKHVQLAAPPPCRYAVDGNTPSYIEAEARSRQSGPFVTVADAARSGGANIAVTEAGVNHDLEPDEGKVMWYDVNVANGGNFYLWALANGPDSESNSFWLSADGLADVQLDLPATWGWVRTTTASLNLATGKHTLKIKVRKDGALLDKIVLTKSAAFTPTGLGGTALACNGLFAPTGLMATPGNASVALSWNPVVGATSYTVKRSTTSGSGYMTVQSGITGTTFNNMGLTNGTPYFFVVSASNAAGESPNSSEVPATPVAAPPPTWTSQDVGAVATAGSWTLNGGVHTLRGNGADIWAANDEFRFTHQQLTGDGTITARLVTFTGTGTINANAKAGVMIRQSLAANSAHVLACLPVQGQITQVKAIKREATGNLTSVSQTGGAPGFPRWVRVTRTGTTLTAYQSTNGTNFTQLGTPTSGLTGTVFVGLAVTSHVDGTNYTATFDSVTITTPMPQPPGPPTNLACTAGNGQCACSWTAPPSATSYNLKRSLTSGSGYAPVVSNHPMTSFTDTTPANGVQHFYVVSANNANGEGANSTQVNCTPVAPIPPPSAPTDLTATGGTGQAMLNWTDTASNETGFKIERKPLGSPDTSFAQIATVGTNIQSYLNSPLTGGDYTYRVRATNGSGDSPFSNSADATVTTPPNPAAPSNLVATVTGGNTANLTWTDNSNNETGFRVERKVGAGSYATLATKAANVTSHADGPLATGTYSYRVIATGSADSAPSNEAVVIIVNPVADAYVREGTNAGNNYGTETFIKVKLNTTVNNNRRGYVRFSLAGVAANVTSAKLRLYGVATTNTKNVGVHAVSNVTWGETTINFSNAPAMTTPAIETRPITTTAAYVEWDVTSYIQQQRTANATAVSLGLLTTSSFSDTETNINSRENAGNKPLLIINSRP